MCFALACFARAALLAGIVETGTGKAYECITLGQLGLVCV